jgi:uncharacterized cupredoxin-like copper-binding protein
MVTVGVALLGGCSSSGSDGDTTPSTATTQKPDATVEVVLKDTQGLDAPMTVSVSPKTVAAGTIEFTVKNAGTIKHEILLVATNGNELTPGADGKVSEEGIVFSMLDIPPGDTRGVISDVPAGQYELLCNLKGHYAEGQHVSFEVT